MQNSAITAPTSTGSVALQAVVGNNLVPMLLQFVNPASIGAVNNINPGGIGDLSNVGNATAGSSNADNTGTDASKGSCENALQTDEITKANDTSKVQDPTDSSNVSNTSTTGSDSNISESRNIGVAEKSGIVIETGKSVNADGTKNDTITSDITKMDDTEEIPIPDGSD